MIFRFPNSFLGVFTLSWLGYLDLYAWPIFIKLDQLSFAFTTTLPYLTGLFFIKVFIVHFFSELNRGAIILAVIVMIAVVHKIKLLLTGNEIA